MAAVSLTPLIVGIVREVGAGFELASLSDRPPTPRLAGGVYQSHL